MLYRVILTSNGEYKKTLHKARTRETIFVNFHALKKANKVSFPRRFVNNVVMTSVKYEICITKPTEPSDVFRVLRDDYGKTYREKPIGDWTILHSEPYDIEETFWMHGMPVKGKERPTIKDIVKRLMVGAHTKTNVKQVIVVHNKLVIYNENQFEMVMCKCKLDAQRLHHELRRVATKQRMKTLLFMGTATPASVSTMYEIIRTNTGWPIEKIRRTSTRP